MFSEAKDEAVDIAAAELVLEHFKKNADLAGIHLRDARNLLEAAKAGGRPVAKGCVLLSLAALESNLAYCADLALTLHSAKKGSLYREPEVNFLLGVEEFVTDTGEIRQRAQRQPLRRRLRLIPKLLGRAFGKSYELQDNRPEYQKLLHAIDRRDAIVHPRWDRYLEDLTSEEAAEAVDAVELCLESIMNQLHPYMPGYFPLLVQEDKEGRIGERTDRGKVLPVKFSSLEDRDLRNALLDEWFDADMMLQLALAHPTEGDSEGSMLTRAALVMMYAMVDAHLSIATLRAFSVHTQFFAESEFRFLLEVFVELGEDGELMLVEDHQSFKSRVVAVPKVLIRRVANRDLQLDVSGVAWQKFIEYHRLRDKVLHAKPGEHIPRVSKAEMVEAAEAVRAYFDQLATGAPELFDFYKSLLKEMFRPRETR